ncbi:MFS transporter (plasmid) [Streptomyces sp. NBC_01387]|uniref:MFS transporter n=1 Tax=unclassified Streptomyces TaxID=2593676 RepID=UPI002024CBF8|nr:MULTISPECIES: MFS transporter [unclassified Streptomyces]MCX4554402.1 MFS transporter [Streptomyces sp. NBC_01500]WSC25218.1 MFS transporter [Streptomyces sp. NBC_01766]WSV58906.1 MFS transporter [Streptomyces sp. NBC_01014]
MATETTPAQTGTATTPPPDTTTGRRSWGALLVVLAGLFITNLDFFIVNVAIPSLQSDMNASSAQIQFVAATFNIGLSAALITGGRLGDLYGRRRIFSIGLALFTLASLACGLAPNMGVLIGARGIQGAAAALVIPQVLGILTTTYSGKDRVTAFNGFGLALGASAVFGQLIGGLLIKADVFGLDWRSIFLINVPIGAAVLLITPRVVPESKAEGRTGFDLTGVVLVTAGLTAVILPLVQGREQGWPTWTWECLIAAVPLLAAFWIHQRRLHARGRSPLVSPALFHDRAFRVGVVGILVFFAAMASFFLVLALFLQEGHGVSALDSGLLFVPLGIGFFLSSTQAPRIAAKLGRQVLALGALILAVSDVALAETALHIDNGSVAWCIPAMLFCGIGMGLVVAPLTSLVLEGVAPEHAAAASGVFSTAQEMGNAVGIAAIGVVFFNTLGTRHGPGAFADAFSSGLFVQAAICVGVAALVQLLPRPARQN